MSLRLPAPDQTIQRIVAFLQRTYQEQHKMNAVIAVSGGIDSALSLALLAQALPKERITVLYLPYGNQSYEDAVTISEYLSIPASNRRLRNIQPVVDAAESVLAVAQLEPHRRGNLMARARMMLVFDTAKELDALVCGTENKSEHYLGYYTRFGDAASDIEPIASLYKTQVRQLAEYLGFPAQFLSKPPSAGLWHGQTDEHEMGFSYEVADQVLHQLVDQHLPPAQVRLAGMDHDSVAKVLQQVQRNRFKFHVPYLLNESVS